MKRQAIFMVITVVVFGFLLVDGMILTHTGFCQAEEEEEPVQPYARPDTRSNLLLEGAGSGHKFWNVDNNPDSPLIPNAGSAQGGESPASTPERMKPFPSTQQMRPTAPQQQMRPRNPLQQMRPTSPVK